MRSLFDPAEPRPQPPGREVLTVSGLNARVRGLLEEALPPLWVEGEISNLRRYPSGHTYFTLKDAAAQISAVLFRGHAQALRFRPGDGMKVLARGRVGLYEARGTYQIVVDALEPAGLGALQMALEQLKARLLAEGLLDAARKRPLPALPRRIGIVTSPEGAAIRDILRVLKRRFANVQVLIAPARVQGAEAAPEVAAALRALNRIGDLDVLIVARGGGSIEDLWAFNEEVVARAIASSRIPVISAVGHETDVTLADLVADVRAPTPSAAAEMVVVSKIEMALRIASLRKRLLLATRLRIGDRRHRLEAAGADRALGLVRTRVRDAVLAVDEWDERLRRRLVAHLVDARHHLEVLMQRMAPARLADRVRERGQRLRDLRGRLSSAVGNRRTRAADRIAAGAGRLEALSPLAVLARGYAICYDSSGGILKDARAARPGSAIRVRLHRGRLACEVREVEDVTRKEGL